MIKKIVITLILFTSIYNANSQNELKLVKIGNKSFIEVSNATLIKFLNQPISNWRTSMKQNGYKLMDDSEGIITYMKGKIGRFQTIAKNKAGVVSIDWYDYVGKIKTLTKLEKSLDNYFIEKKGNLKYFIYKDYVIGIKSSETNDYEFEEVLIKHK